MNIKVQCSCETKFSFDVEPAEGKMPATIFCPKCGADATEIANDAIQQNLGASPPPVAETAPKPRIRLQVAHQPSAASAPENADGIVAPIAEMCHRHTRNVATEHCVVCQKAICPECMETFGFLCSINCRYRADQEGIKVPKYKLQRNNVEKGETRKTLALTAVGAVILLMLIGAYFWLISVGMKPRPFYSLKVESKESVYAKFLGPDKILMLKKTQVSLHDIKAKKDLWSTALEDPKPVIEANPANATTPQKKSDEDFEEEDFAPDDYQSFDSIVAPPFFYQDDLWVCLSHRAVCVDLKSGSVKYAVPFEGRMSAFTPGESTLLIVSEKVQTNKIVTQINLASGEAKIAVITSALREESAVSKQRPTGVLPTAAALMREEMEAGKKNRRSIYTWSSEFFPAGPNMVEMQVKLVEPKMETVETIKAPGPSNLGSDTRASTSARAVLEEISNDMKRSSGGGSKRVDVSRYSVTLRRSLEENVPDWTGEVTSLPVFFPQKTVDTLFAGKTLYLFDKQNKKIAESQLSYPIDDGFSSGFRASGSSPCVETNNTLYVFDKGVLTAFELPSAMARWRLTSVGISRIQFDEKGMLYVSTTTAAPEDIQYSEQIKVGDSIEPIILKVDPKSGKTLWKSKQTGGGCFLTGKYLYITDAGRRGFAMIQAVEEAFNSNSKGQGSFELYRMNPSNGKRKWSFVKKGFPENVDFANNRILLHYTDEIEIMKFISF